MVEIARGGDSSAGGVCLLLAVHGRDGKGREGKPWVVHMVRSLERVCLWEDPLLYCF